MTSRLEGSIQMSTIHVERDVYFALSDKIQNIIDSSCPLLWRVEFNDISWLLSFRCVFSLLFSRAILLVSSSVESSTKSGFHHRDHDSVLSMTVKWILHGCHRRSFSNSDLWNLWSKIHVWYINHKKLDLHLCKWSLSTCVVLKSRGMYRERLISIVFRDWVVHAAHIYENVHKWWTLKVSITKNHYVLHCFR